MSSEFLMLVHGSVTVRWWKMETLSAVILQPTVKLSTFWDSTEVHSRLYLKRSRKFCLIKKKKQRNQTTTLIPMTQKKQNDIMTSHLAKRENTIWLFLFLHEIGIKLGTLSHGEALGKNTVYRVWMCRLPLYGSNSPQKQPERKPACCLPGLKHWPADTQTSATWIGSFNSYADEGIIE